MDIEKVNQMKGCDDCVFCACKCPKCGTVDIEVVYAINPNESAALIRCKCSKTVNRELEFMGNVVQDCSYDLIEAPELKTHLDKIFKAHKWEIQEGYETWEMENDEEDILDFSCVDGKGRSTTPSNINMEIFTNRKGNHLVNITSETAALVIESKGGE